MQIVPGALRALSPKGVNLEPRRFFGVAGAFASFGSTTLGGKEYSQLQLPKLLRGPQVVSKSAPTRPNSQQADQFLPKPNTRNAPLFSAGLVAPHLCEKPFYVKDPTCVMGFDVTLWKSRAS